VNQRVPRVERGGVEVGAARTFGEREALHLERGGIDADDGVEAAVGDPRKTVWTDDDAVGCGALAVHRD
jgi:hypothetical protein